ncbi:hypothetical protein ATANTOWER_019423 [Ataeniobius toweri]|uniref:Secreted protein n=1 Tax=Ataeniobius toweri TaxID=208326 RepID=A0ABU7AYN7_9TELE|nr:hypothetical protein [Ataeniobius toweri]
MRVGMCDCVCLFFVSGWVLGCSLSWICLGPPSNVGPISSPPHYLPVVGVSARRCTCQVNSSQVYLYSAFQQQGTQSAVHEEKHYNDTENQTQKNKSNDINNPWEFTGKSWF